MTRKTTKTLAVVAVAVGVAALAVAIWLLVTGGPDWDVLLGAVIGLAAIVGGVLTLWQKPTEDTEKPDRTG